MEYKISDQHLQEAVRDLHTISDFIRWTACCFESNSLCFGHGTDNGWDESVTLILDTLNIPKETGNELLNCRLTETEKKLITHNISERINHSRPLAYLTNSARFAGHEFFVDERVLIPRSPIAELIENHFEPWLLHPPKSILDLCTGGGCIALSCAMAFPEASVTGSDISAEALEVAAINAEKYGLQNETQFIQSDLFANLKGQTFDLIVSNPPYVDAQDMASLPDEYHFEPELGLASGEDGLDITRVILAQAAEHLNEGGTLIVEVGNSAPALEDAFPDLPFTWLEFTRGGDGVFLLEKIELSG